jgi:hypothetical protein
MISSITERGVMYGGEKIFDPDRGRIAEQAAFCDRL